MNHIPLFRMQRPIPRHKWSGVQFITSFVISGRPRWTSLQPHSAPPSHDVDIVTEARCHLNDEECSIQYHILEQSRDFNRLRTSTTKDVESPNSVTFDWFVLEPKVLKCWFDTLQGSKAYMAPLATIWCGVDACQASTATRFMLRICRRFNLLR